MANLPWFPAFAEKWMSSPAINRMLPEQEGAYWRLLVVMWAGSGESEPHLPTEDEALAQMSRLGPRWEKLGPLIRQQFDERDGLLYNRKLSEVWKEQQKRYQKRARAGRKGGQAKASRKQSSGIASPKPREGQTDAPLVLRGVIDPLPSSTDGAPAPSEARAVPAVEEFVSSGPQNVRRGGMARLGDLIPTAWRPRSA